MSLFDLNDPFFKPLWIRVAIVVVTASWSAFEFIAGEHLWAILFGGVCAISIHGFFIAFNPRERDENTKK